MSILADGQVATTQTTIFEAGGADVFGSASFDIEKITLFNTNSITQTVILYIKDFGGIARKLRQFILLENESGEYLEPGDILRLNNGDVIQAETTTAGAVDFVVFATRT